MILLLLLLPRTEYLDLLIDYTVTMTYLFLITNCITMGKWRLGAWDIHYWQPAPRWRLLLWLANLNNPALSFHTGKGNRHPSHWINSGKREGRGGENSLGNKLPLQTMLKVHTQSTHKNTSNKEYIEFQCIHICKNCWLLHLMLMLFAVNSVKLH